MGLGYSGAMVQTAKKAGFMGARLGLGGPRSQDSLRRATCSSSFQLMLCSLCFSHLPFPGGPAHPLQMCYGWFPIFIKLQEQAHHSENSLPGALPCPRTSHSPPFHLCSTPL